MAKQSEHRISAVDCIVNPLSIYIVWHPKFSCGNVYAKSFFTHFMRDVHNPLSRGMGIPVYFRTGEKPLNIKFGDAKRNVIILLISDQMVVDEEWQNYVQQLNESLKGNKDHLIIPVATSNSAVNMPGELPKKNFLRLYEEEKYKTQWLLSRTTHEICRLVYDIERVNYEDPSSRKSDSPQPLKLFISHAKLDGVCVAEKLRDYIRSETAMESFYDANDISIGYDFAQEIEDDIQKSVLLVIHSDYYSSREWCRREILMAKKYNRPIIIVNFYEEGEKRSFPYMANLKTIRFNHSIDEKEMFEKIILLTLKETLRFKYHKLFAAQLLQIYSIEIPETAILSHPPELLSLLYLKEIGERSIYPDPPLSQQEIHLLDNLGQQTIQFITPTMVPLLDEPEDSNPSILHNMKIGILISESQDIEQLGYNHLHLQDALVEFSRYFLAYGLLLSYGGDVRYNSEFNFVDILFDLARTYQHEMGRPSERITNYVSYPIHTQITDEEKAELYKVAKFECISPPNNIPQRELSQVIKAESPDDLYIWARSLSEMRRIMNDSVDARIMIGGKLSGYKGKMPGVIEEAYLAMQAEQPLYLIGFLGGATKAVIDCLLGEDKTELTEEEQFKNPTYKALHTRYNELATINNHERIDYHEVVDFFKIKGINALNNGLTKEENKTLFSTTNSTEMISLVLKGLINIQSN